MNSGRHAYGLGGVLAIWLICSAASGVAGESKLTENRISRGSQVAVGTFGEPIAAAWSELVLRTKLVGSDVKTGPLDKLKDKGTHFTWSAVYARAPYTMWYLSEATSHYPLEGAEKTYADACHRLRSYAATTGERAVGGRTHAVIAGGMTWPGTAGGPGGGPGVGGPGGRSPNWFSLAVDMDMDVDSNRVNGIAGVDRNDSDEAKEEDRLEDDTSNPIGALVAVGCNSPLILRKAMEVNIELQERLPSLIEGHLLIVPLEGSDGAVELLEAGTDKPALESYQPAGATQGMVCKLRGDLFLRMLRGLDVELDVRGTAPGTVTLHALLAVKPKGSEIEATEFADTVRLSVVDLHILAGRVDETTGRGAAGSPEEVLYEPEFPPVAASNPVPRIKLSTVNVANVRGGVDSPITADISIAGEAYYALADIIEGDSANLTKVFVEVNGQPLRTLDLAVVEEQRSILRPFARKFTYSGNLVGVPLAPDKFSALVVKVQDPAVGNVGYAGARIEIEPVVSADPYDFPIGESLHPVITGGTAQPLKCMVDLSRGQSLAELAGLGPHAIGTRAKLSFGGDQAQSVQRGGLLLTPGEDPVIALADGVSKITIKDASGLTFDGQQESFTAEVYLPEKWPDPVEMLLVETGPQTSVFQSFLLGVELSMEGQEPDPDRPDAVEVKVSAISYDDEWLIGRWQMQEDGDGSWVFWGDEEKTVGLKIECLTPASNWSHGFMRMRMFNGAAWGVDGLPVDVGQKYIGVNIYDQEHLIQEVPGALDARLGMATGPWKVRQIVKLQESAPGPYTPFVARLRGPALALAEATAGTKCKVFDKEHTWSVEYGETWCGGSSQPGVFTMMELPTPGKDFGAGHLDDKARFIFFSVSGKQQYELIQTKRKDACRVAGKLFEVLRQVATERREKRFDPSKDPGKSYLHLKGPSFSSPKRYRGKTVLQDGNRLLYGYGTAYMRYKTLEEYEDEKAAKKKRGEPVDPNDGPIGEGYLTRTAGFHDYFVPEIDEYLDPRYYFGALLLDFLKTGIEDRMARVEKPDDPVTYVVDAAIEKMSASCGGSPIFSQGPNGLYMSSREMMFKAEIEKGIMLDFPAGIERGIFVKMGGYQVENFSTIYRNAFRRWFGGKKWLEQHTVGLTEEYFPVEEVMKDGQKVKVESNYQTADILKWNRQIHKGELNFAMPVWRESLAEDPCGYPLFKAEQLVLNKHFLPGGLHSLGSMYLVGQHTPYTLAGFDAVEDPLANTQNVTQILHFNTGIAFGRYLPHMRELLDILKKGGAGRNQRLLTYMSQHNFLPIHHQARLDSIAKIPGGVGIASCMASRDRQFDEMLIALKMVQAWENQTGRTPTPLDFFVAYDIASGECFHLFGTDPFDDIIATQAGYLFRDTLANAGLPRADLSFLGHIPLFVQLFEEDMKTARGQFRRHESLRYGIADGKDSTGRDGLLRSFLAMQLTHGKIGNEYTFVPVVAEMESAATKKGLDGKPVRDKNGDKISERVVIKGLIWDETIGTVVNANIKSGLLSPAGDYRHERIDDAKEQTFLDKVKQLLTVPDSGYMTSEYDGSDAYINARAMVKLNEMVEVLMFIDEEPQ